MITLVGVGHVFAISGRLAELVHSIRPDIVCLELDPVRFQALVRKDTTGRVPIQYSLLAMFQKRMADKFESEVGGEMIAAATAAKEVGAGVALIDVDSSRMLATLWRRMPMRERIGLLFGALVGLVSSKEAVEREIDAYQSNDEAYIEEIGAKFPTLKAVLIDDRNRVMANRIRGIARDHERVMVVIGDGHVPGIAKSLEGEQVEIVRLRQLMNAPKMSADSAEHSTSFVLGEQYG